VKNRNLIAGVVLLVAAVAIVLVMGPRTSKKGMKPVVQPGKQPVRMAPQAPAKKAISKGKGGLTVKILDSKKKDMSVRVRAFKTVDSRSSEYVASFVANRMQEIRPGNYDIEIDTVPQKIYKNVNVVEGKENIENLGQITSSLNVKLKTSKGKDATYPIKVLYPQSDEVVVIGATNRPVEIIAGVYDIDVTMYPRLVKKEVRLAAGKEEIIDLGNIMGSLAVKVLDENGKEARYAARIINQEKNELITTTMSNRPMDISQGTYTVEVASTPKQVKKDVKVAAGGEANVEFTVETPKPVVPTPPPARPTAPPVKPKK